MEIDGDRLRADIEQNAAFGAVETEEDDRGRTVLTGSDADQEARNYLVSQLEDADMDVSVDPVGNILGVWVPAGVEASRQPVVSGSHLDSVPRGGIFDGPLGVYAALEAVRAIRDADVEPDAPLAVVNFTEEEGTRFPPLSGSSVASGVRDAESVLAETDSDGTTLQAALDGIGYHGGDTIDASAWDAFLEVHIEQGSRLEDAGVPVGVVTDITGISQVDIEIVGESDHAGTTSMADRADPLVAAAEVIQAVEAIALERFEHSESVVGTVGRIDVTPNATNVIPERTKLGVDIRDIDRASMDIVQEGLRSVLDRIAAERRVEGSFSKRIDIDPTPLADRAIEAVHRGAHRASVETIQLHSGAGHDTMHIAGVTHAGMLFAPSVDGASHSPREWTSWEDCETVTRVLAEAMIELA